MRKNLLFYWLCKESPSKDETFYTMRDTISLESLLAELKKYMYDLCWSDYVKALLTVLQEKLNQKTFQQVVTITKHHYDINHTESFSHNMDKVLYEHLLFNIYQRKNLTLQKRLQLREIYRRYKKHKGMNQTGFGFEQKFRNFILEAHKEETYSYTQLRRLYLKNLDSDDFDKELNAILVHSLLQFPESKKKIKEMYTHQLKIKQVDLLKKMVHLIEKI